MQKKLAESYADAQRELVTYRALKAQRDSGDTRVTNDMLKLLGTRASTGFKFVSNRTKRLSKKYTVDIEPGYEKDGRQYITVTLKDKLGNTYMHEIYSNVRSYGDYLYPENYK